MVYRKIYRAILIDPKVRIVGVQKETGDTCDTSILVDMLHRDMAYSRVPA